MNTFLKILLVSVLIISFSTTAFAQQDANQNQGDLASESLQDFYVVAGIGLGGAILGLSTISFTGDASIKEHSNRIQTGTALGIILGVIVVASSQAERSSKLFVEEPQASLSSPKEFTTAMRMDWHQEVHFSEMPSDQVPQVGYNWLF